MHNWLHALKILQKQKLLDTFLEALIAEYFYKKSIVLNLANQELLSLTDYKDFLKKCAYPQKFKNR